MKQGNVAFSIHELAIPESPQSPTWRDFEAAIALHFANEADSYGTDELGFTAIEALPAYLDQENQPTRLFVARVGDLIVGLARYQVAPGDDPHTAWLMIDVRGDFRGRGIGSALSSWMQSVARTDGVRKFIVYTVSAGDGADRMPSPTGFGSVPVSNPEVQFLLGRGYRLEQVVRCSRLALPVDISELLADAMAKSSGEYTLHFWRGGTPEHWRGDVAHLRTTMSVEEPTAGLEEPEDVWTPERLLADDDLQERSPRLRFTAAVEHTPSSSLVGFTVLSAPAEIDRAVAQDDTLVLPTHRGHRLGMLLKAANIDYLQRTRPGHPSIITFNAEENRHMLDVNEAVGFTPIGYEGAWRKDLPG